MFKPIFITSCANLPKCESENINYLESAAFLLVLISLWGVIYYWKSGARDKAINATLSVFGFLAYLVQWHFLSQEGMKSPKLTAFAVTTLVVIAIHFCLKRYLNITRTGN